MSSPGPDASRRQALELLADLPFWRLPPAAWRGVTDTLEVMAAAWRRGDGDTFAETVMTLEGAAPRRAWLRLMREAAEPCEPPASVLERVGRLEIDLAGDPEPQVESEPPRESH